MDKNQIESLRWRMAPPPRKPTLHEWMAAVDIDVGCEFDPKLPMRNPNRTPYNTGKVLIGSRYEPPKLYQPDADGEFWQGVLLGEHQHRRKQTIRMAAYVAVLILVMFLLAAWSSK